LGNAELPCGKFTGKTTASCRKENSGVETIADWRALAGNRAPADQEWERGSTRALKKKRN